MSAVANSNILHKESLKIIVPQKWNADACAALGGESLNVFFQALEGLIVEHVSGVLEHTTRYNLQSGAKGPYVFQMDFKGTLGGFATLSHIPGFIEAINIINPYSANYMMMLSNDHYIMIGHEYGKDPHSLPPKEMVVGKPVAVCPSAPARPLRETAHPLRESLLEPKPRMPSPIPSGAQSPVVVQNDEAVPVVSQGSDLASLQSSMDSLQLDTIKARSVARYRTLLSELANLQQQTYLMEEQRKDMLKQINDNKKRMHVLEFAMDEIIDLMGGPEFMRA